MPGTCDYSSVNTKVSKCFELSAIGEHNSDTSQMILVSIHFSDVFLEEFAA